MKLRDHYSQEGITNVTDNISRNIDYIGGYIVAMQQRLNHLEEHNRILTEWRKETVDAINELRINIMQGFDPYAMKGAVELGIKDSLRPTEFLSDHLEKVVLEQVEEKLETLLDKKLKETLGNVEIDIDARLRW